MKKTRDEKIENKRDEKIENKKTFALNILKSE